MKKCSAIFCLLVTTLAAAVDVEQLPEYVIPDSPPSACILQIANKKTCTTFPLVPGFYLTAAHCLLDYDMLEKKFTYNSADQVKMYCPSSVDAANPKEYLYYLKFHQMEVTHVTVNQNFKFDLLDQNDFALVQTTYSLNTGKPFPKPVFSEEEQTALFKRNKCRAAGYSRGFYAENLSRRNAPTIEDGILKMGTASDRGDSGGPIYCENEKGEDVIVGINSSVIGDLPILPAVHWFVSVLQQMVQNSTISQ